MPGLQLNRWTDTRRLVPLNTLTQRLSLAAGQRDQRVIGQYSSGNYDYDVIWVEA